MHRSELTLQRILGVFKENGVSGDVTISGDRLLLKYPHDISVTLWVDQLVPDQLRMRVIPLPSGERDLLNESELEDWECDENQQMNELGTLSTRNALGVALEYALPFKTHLHEETIVEAANRLAQRAVNVRKMLETFRRSPHGHDAK